MEQFKEYFKVLKIDTPTKDRIKEIFDFYESICEEEITDIFINTIVSKDSKIIFDNMFFFTETKVMEAKCFLTKDQFDMDFLKECIWYWEVTKENYDFSSATPDSRLNILVKQKNRYSLLFKAEGNNCDELKKIFEKFIIPNHVP